MLQVIVGMIFTFMLLSLLGTTVNELIASWRGWRGFYMEEGLKRLLQQKDNPEIFEKFRNNPIYKQLLQHDAPLRVSQAPAYLSADNFTSILTNILKKKGEVLTTVDEFIQGVPEDSELRRILEQLKEEGHENLGDFKNRLQSWFNDIMGEAGGWYKRHLQFVTLFVGLGIAAVFNADSFAIYKHLTTNTQAATLLEQMAEKYTLTHEVPTLTTNPTPPVATPTTPADTSAIATVTPADTSQIATATPAGNSISDIKSQLTALTESNEFSAASNILGLGWRPADLQSDWRQWGIRLLGWLVTALAVSLGAPFWFDILKKIITIRSSGSSSQAGTGVPNIVINTVRETTVEAKGN